MSARLERSAAGAWVRRAHVVRLAAAQPGQVASVLELFSGTGSFSQAALRAVPGARVVSVDIRASQHPTHVADILTWDYRSAVQPGEFDIVWASPPCTEYSVAKTVGERNLAQADACVLRAFEIIDYVKPRVWFMENPATGMLPERMKSLRPGLTSAIADYCQYGFPYRKRTCFWSNLPELSHGLRLCPGREECVSMRNGRHLGSVGGGPHRDQLRFSLAEKHRMPQELVDWLFWRACGGLVVLPPLANSNLHAGEA